MYMKVKESITSVIGKIWANSHSKLSQKFGFKDRQPKHLKHDLVCEITCSCGRRYIGETCRALKTRFDEHMKTSGSGITEVGKHLSSSPSFKITFEQCKVLTYESNMRICTAGKLRKVSISISLTTAVWSTTKWPECPCSCSVCPPIKINWKVEFSLVFRGSGTGSPVSMH
jgi:hypothetical protein